VTTLRRWREEPLTRRHDRAAFDCGVAALNEYLQRYARQNHESGGAKTFVAVEADLPTRVLGYYTIASGALDFAEVPDMAKRGLARYDVPVFRLGRLAISTTEQGRGLGGALLMAAGQRALTVAEAVGGVALAIDAKDEAAAGWYERFGAVRLIDDPLALVLPLATIAAALRAADKTRT
jgi:GNAT superfamily N-acetyltransferase